MFKVDEASIGFHQFFSILDLLRGYGQVGMSSTLEKTASSTTDELYEFKVNAIWPL